MMGGAYIFYRANKSTMAMPIRRALHITSCPTVPIFSSSLKISVDMASSVRQGKTFTLCATIIAAQAPSIPERRASLSSSYCSISCQKRHCKQVCNMTVQNKCTGIQILVFICHDVIRQASILRAHHALQTRFIVYDHIRCARRST